MPPSMQAAAVILIIGLPQGTRMRVRLKGINSITKTLADGTKRTYYYAWKGGPPLRGEPGTPEFIASYNEAVARKVVSPRGTLLSVLQGYQASDDFTGLAPRSRSDYVAKIKLIEKEFGDFPLSDLLRLPWSAYNGTHI